MRTIQIAIQLQIIGFFIGSVILALVEITGIKKFATAIKEKILNFTNAHRSPIIDKITGTVLTKVISGYSYGISAEHRQDF